MPRQRIALIDHTPSTVLLQKHGRRESEKTLLEGDGLNAMMNLDGSITIEIYNQRESIILRMTAEDVKAQSHVLKEWANRRS